MIVKKGKQKVMEDRNEECVIRALISPLSDIGREKETEEKRLLKPPLLADKSAVNTRGCKDVMAKS